MARVKTLKQEIGSIIIHNKGITLDEIKAKCEDPKYRIRNLLRTMLTEGRIIEIEGKYYSNARYYRMTYEQKMTFKNIKKKINEHKLAIYRLEHMLRRL